MTTFDQWRTEVQPYLQDVRHHARGAALAVRQIAIRPAFITEAQHEMDELERTLADALTTVRQARAEFAAKKSEAA